MTCGVADISKLELSVFLTLLLLLSVFGALAALALRRLPKPFLNLTAIVPAALFVSLLSNLSMVSTMGTVVETHAWVPSIGVELAWTLDGFSLLFALLITGVGTLVTLYACAYFSERSNADRARFVCLIQIFMTAMLGTVLSDNLVSLFVFWELTSLTSFLLIGFEAKKPEARRAALQSLLEYRFQVRFELGNSDLR